MKTATRKPATDQQCALILCLLSDVSFDMDFAADVIERCALATNNSSYSDYGSVNLAEVAREIRDEIDAATVPAMCSHCSGSGEGQYDGATCSKCRGHGEISPTFEVAA